MIATSTHVVLNATTTLLSTTSINIVPKTFSNSFLGLFSADAIFFITVFVIYLAYGLYFGRGRLVSLILAFYPTVIFYKSLPFLNSLIIMQGDNLILANKVAVFLFILIPIILILNRYIDALSEYFDTGSMLRSAVMSAGVVILILIFSYSVINFDAFHDFSPFIDGLFATPDKIFYWSLVPIALLTAL
jgi:hypothetical protein